MELNEKLRVVRDAINLLLELEKEIENRSKASKTFEQRIKELQTKAHVGTEPLKIQDEL